MEMKSFQTTYLGPLFLLSFIMIGALTSCNRVEISGDRRGIGPVTELQLEPINDSLMKLGTIVFKEGCSDCHTMELKNTGPDISDILAVRKPEWVVNFLLNKDEMLERDSLALITLANYEQPCGSNLESMEEALHILEYLRIYQIWLHEINAGNLR
jgi:cytochrome c